MQRKLAKRNAKNRILLVCEGNKTEPNYFKSFRITSADVIIIGEGFNTTSLVKRAKAKERQAHREELPYDQIWCVFDKDSFTKDQFNTAINMAELHGYKVAFSNEAFELWYILHFEYLKSGITRDKYIKNVIFYYLYFSLKHYLLLKNTLR